MDSAKPVGAKKLTLRGILETTALCGAMVAYVMAGGSVYASSIDEAVMKALSAHPAVTSAASSYRQADHAIDQARAGWRPRVDISLDTGYEYTNSSGTRGRATRGDGGSPGVDAWATSANMTVTQTLMDFGRTDREIDAAVSLRDSSGHLLVNTQIDIAVRTTTAFMSAVRAQDLQNLVVEYLAWHNDILEKTRLNVSSGIATATDEASVLARQQQAQNRAIQFDGQMRDAEARYIEAVGDIPEDLEDPELDTDIDFVEGLEGLLERMYEASPTLKASQSIIEARRSQRGAAEGEFFPTITTEMQLNRVQNADGVRAHRHDGNAFLKMDWNLYNGGADVAALRAAEADIDTAIGQEGQEKRRLEQELRLAYNRFLTARDQLEYTENQVNAAINVVDGRETEFELDRATLDDLLTARNQQFEAEVALINLTAEYASSYYALMSLTGELFDVLEISAPQTILLEEGSVTEAAPAFEAEEDAPEETEETVPTDEEGDDGLDLMFDIGAPPVSE